MPASVAVPPVVSMLYPNASETVAMGNSMKFIAQVKDAQGNPLPSAQVSLTIQDPNGKAVATIPTTVDSAGTARSDYWKVPHRQIAGEWTVTARATEGSASAEASTKFRVQALGQ